MDLKQKLDSIKTKIKKHHTEIFAVTSAGIAVAATIGWKLTLDKLEKSNTINRELLEHVTKGETFSHEAVYISDETTDEVLSGSKDVWFDIRGKRCDLILHSEED
jgi:hypothetical protein